MAAALADFHTSIAPLNATLLKQRREYIPAYHDSLLADMGGPPLSKHMQMRLVALERYSFSAGQVLAFRGLAAASAKPSLLALQRKLRAEREKARRERERKQAAERRKQQEREKREAERAARIAAREAQRTAESQRRAALREAKKKEREEKEKEEAEKKQRGSGSPTASAASSAAETEASAASTEASAAAAAAAAAAAVAEAEKRRRDRAALVVQRRQRARREAKLSAASVILAIILGRRYRRSFLERREASVRVQAVARRHRMHGYFKRLRHAVELIQKVWRGVAARRSYVRMKV